MTGGDPAYDGPFYRERSPINDIAEVDVPTFLVGGEYDLFQRGTPLLFEKLQQRGVPVKMIIGPWDHLEGSSGAEVGEAGYGTLDELQLRWFDHYVKGKEDRRWTATSSRSPTTSRASGKWRTARKWVGRDRTRRRSGCPGSRDRRHARRAHRGAPEPARRRAADPGPGLCTRSTNQWTAGILNTALGRQPVPDRQPAQRPGGLGLPDHAAEKPVGSKDRSTPGSTSSRTAATACWRSRSRTWRPTAASPGSPAAGR